MQALLDWLVADFDVYGMPIQRWALMVGVMVVITSVVLLKNDHKSR